MTFEEIQKLAEKEMQTVNGLILDRLKSEVALINQLGIYIIGAGGKRLRPLLAVLCARALGYEGQGQYQLAAIVEFIHTATLLHDDVVDESQLRRGRETANELFGNQASVLVGDYLYTRAFQMMTELNNPEVLKIFADTTNIISEGEVMQLMNVHDFSISEQRYLEVIKAKTAALFEATTRLTALISGKDKLVQQALADYGRLLGQAFQLTDDALDYSSESEVLGKNIGDDLAEGKPTLPLIYALKNGNKMQQQLIQQAIDRDGIDQLDKIQQIIHETGALEYTLNQAKACADRAKATLSVLTASPYKNALLALADFSVKRSH